MLETQRNIGVFVPTVIKEPATSSGEIFCSFEKYKAVGGVLSLNEYSSFLHEIAGRGLATNEETPTFYRAAHMAESCDLQPGENLNMLIATYTLLREDSPPRPNSTSKFPALSTQCDQKVFAEALRLNGMEDAYRQFTERNPVIFMDS